MGLFDMEMTNALQVNNILLSFLCVEKECNWTIVKIKIEMNSVIISFINEKYCRNWWIDCITDRHVCLSQYVYILLYFCTFLYHCTCWFNHSDILNCLNEFQPITRTAYWKFSATKISKSVTQHVVFARWKVRLKNRMQILSFSTFFRLS